MHPLSLLAHGRRIRRLAALLLREDAHGAEDAAQETLLQALAREAPDPPRPAGWLEGVLRNNVRRLRRIAARSGSETALAAQADPLPGPAGQLLRESARQEVVSALASLPAPGRDVLTKHDYEEIAEHDGDLWSGGAETRTRDQSANVPCNRA